jgi:hypothetical protein
MSDPQITDFDDDGATQAGRQQTEIEFDAQTEDEATRLAREGFDRNNDLQVAAADTTTTTSEMEDLVKRNSLRESNTTIANRADLRVQEVTSERMFAQQGIMSRVDVWNRNNMRYLGDHWSTYFSSPGANNGPWITQYNIEGAPLVSNNTFNRPGVKLFTDNRIQNAVITSVQNQMSRPPVAKLSAVEANGKRKIYLKADAGFRLADSGFDYMSLGIMPEQVLNPDPNNEDDGPIMPLTERLYQRLLRVPELMQPTPVMVQDPMTGMMAPTGQTNPAILSDEDFWMIDDDLCASTAQKVFDLKVSEAMLEITLNENVLYTSIYGHCPLMVGWDPDTHKLKFSNLHVMHTFPDPTATCLKDMEYLIFDYIISQDAALVRWPWAAKIIESVAQTGQRIGNVYYQTASVYAETDFKREMLTVRTVWERNLPVPMTVDEAMAAGLVVEEEYTPFIDAQGQEYVGEVFETVTEAINEQTLEVETVPAGVFSLSDTAATNPLLPQEPKKRFLLVETGEECWPDQEGRECSDNWPTMMGIRQTQILLQNGEQTGQVIEKARCPYADIPVGWNINIPEPWRPYGQGEPYRLESVQQLINRLWTIVANHSQYYSFPMELWPESLLARMKKSGFSTWGMPGRQQGIPDQQWLELASRGLQTGFFATPAPIPGWFVGLLERALDELDKLSGNTAVMQGNMPSANASGRTVAELKQSAQAIIAYKSMHSQWAFEHVGKVALDAIVKWMPESQWKAIFSGIPWPVLKEIIAAVESTKWNIQFTVYSGRGVVEEIENAQAMQDYAGGGPTRIASRQLTMERRRVPNPAREAKRIDEENRTFGFTAGTGDGQAVQQMVQDATIQASGEPLQRRKAQANSQPPNKQAGGQ